MTVFVLFWDAVSPGGYRAVAPAAAEYEEAQENQEQVVDISPAVRIPFLDGEPDQDEADDFPQAEAEDAYTYTFQNASPVDLSDLLDAFDVTIDSLLTLRVTVDQPENVQLEQVVGFLSYDYRITPRKHFDRAVLSILTRRKNISIILKYPEPIRPGQTVESDAGVFAAQTEVPAGTTLTVSEYAPSAQVLEVVAAQAGDRASLHWMDIALTAEGKKVDAGAAVTVRTDLTLPEAPALNGRTGTTVLRDVRLFHVLDNGTVEELAVSAETEGQRITAISFVTASFSGFALTYTVDFTYDGYTQRMAGGSSALLSQIMRWMRIPENVQDVESVVFSDPALISITRVSGDVRVADAYADAGEGYAFNAGEGDWLLTSLAAFHSNETLTIVTRAGVAYVVRVTDAEFLTNIDGLVVEESLIVNGKKIGPNETAYVRDGMTYVLDLKFKETIDSQFDNEGPLYYDLPEGFVLPDDYTTTLEISLGRRGKLYNPVTYDPEHHRLIISWDRSNPALFEYFTHAATASFELMLQGTVDLTNEQILFKDEASINVVKEDLHNAKVIKDGEFDRTNGVIRYTITVESDGTTENLILTDEQGEALVYLNDCAWDVDASVYVPEEATSWHGQANPVAIENVGGSYQIAIPSMGDGEKLVFHYSSRIDINHIAESGHATFEETGNTVTLAGDEIPEDNVSTHWEDKITYSDLEKDVTGVGPTYTDENNGTRYKDISWEIKTNQIPQVSFAGTAITDVIGESVQEMCEYTGDGIVVRVYNADRELVATREVSWAELGVDITTDKTWTYPIPTDDLLPYTYEVAYQTRIDMDRVNAGKEDVYVDNYAHGKGGQDVAIEIIHPEGTGLGVSKKAVSYTVGDPDTDPVTMGTVEWEMTIHMENGYWDDCQLLTELFVSEVDGATLEPRLKDDKGNTLVQKGMPFSPWMGTSGKRFKESFVSVEVKGLQEGETFLPVSTPTSYANSPDQFEIQFFKNSDQSERGLNAPANGSGSRDITVILKTQYDPAWITLARDLKLHGAVYNHINIVDVGKYLNSKNEKRDAVAEPGARAVDKITPRGTHTTKRVLRSYKSIIGNLKQNAQFLALGDANGTILTKEGPASLDYVYPVILFQVAVTGVSTDEPLIITDQFNTDIFRLWTEKGQYEYINDQGKKSSAWCYYEPKFGGYDTGDWIGSGGASFVWRSVDYHYDVDRWLPTTTVEQTADGVRFIIGEVPKKSDGTFYSTYLVEYWLVPKDAQALQRIAEMALANGGQQTGEAVFTNTVTARGETDEARFEIPLTPEFDPVAKSMVQARDDGGNGINEMRCEIKLNPGKMTLNDGMPMYMTDTYSDTLSINFETIVITTDPASRQDQVSYDFSGNVGTFLIPDETAVTITYTATVVGEANQSIPVWNEAAMLKYKDREEMNVTFTSSSSGSAAAPEINLYKFAAGHMEKGLMGATFQLYQANRTSSGDFEYVPMKTRDTNADIFFTTPESGTANIMLTQTQHGYNFEYSHIVTTTDENGKLRINWDVSDVSMYALKEVAAPHGYEAADFYYRFAIVEENAVPVYADYVYKSGETMTARNSKPTCEVIITKVFAGNAAGDLTDAEKEAITFSIVHDDGKDSPIMKTVLEGDTETQVVDERFSNIHYSSFEDGVYTLTGIAAGAYKLIENHADVTGSHPGWQFESTFSWDGLEDDTFKVTQEDINNGAEFAVTVTNTYTKRVVELQAAKRWQTTKGAAMAWPGGEEITLELYTLTDGVTAPVIGKDGQTVAVTLNGVKDDQGEDRAGVAVFKDLPELPDGSEYVVKERADAALAQGYSVMYGGAGEMEDYARFVPSAGANAATVINRQKSTALSVSKVWKQSGDDTQNPPAGATATFRLYAYAEGADPSTARRVTTVNDVTLNGTIDEHGETGAWTATFSGLPLVNSQGQQLIYIVTEESSTAHYQPDYPAGQDYAASDQTIVNRPETTDFSFRKEWKNTLNDEWPEGEEITVHIKRRLVFDDASPAMDDPSFDAAYTLTRDGWQLGTGSTQPASWDGAAVTPAWTQEGKRGALSLSGLALLGEMDGRGTWEYYVSEDALADYTTTYYLNGQLLDEATAVGNRGVIRNTGSAATQLSFSKEWYTRSISEGDRQGWTDAFPDERITVTLSRQFRYVADGQTFTVADPTNTTVQYVIGANGPDASCPTGDAFGAIASAGDGFTIDHLDRFATLRVDGTLRTGEWIYALAETKVEKRVDGEFVEDNAFQKLSRVDENGRVIFQNVKAETVDVEAQKTWLQDGQPVSAAHRNPVELTLYREVDAAQAGDGHIEIGGKLYVPVTEDALGKGIAPVQVTADNDWRFTFTQLPKFKKDSQAQEHYVIRETAVYINGERTEDIAQYYTLTYPNDQTANNAPKDILTKTSVSVSKVWADGNDNHPDDEVTVRLYQAVQIPEDANVLNVNVRTEWVYSDGITPAPPKILNSGWINFYLNADVSGGWQTIPTIDPRITGANIISSALTDYGGRIYVIENPETYNGKVPYRYFTRTVPNENDYKKILKVEEFINIYAPYQKTVNQTITFVLMEDPPEETQASAGGIVRPAGNTAHLPDQAVQSQYKAVLKKDQWEKTFVDLPTAIGDYPVTYYAVEESVKTDAEIESVHYTRGADGGWIITNVPRQENPSVSVSISGLKELRGRELKANEFTFILAPADGGAAAYPGLTGTPPRATAKNAADGSFSFDLELTKESVDGVSTDYPVTLTYLLTEEHAGEIIDSVLYSTQRYWVQVTVKKDGGFGLIGPIQVFDHDPTAQSAQAAPASVPAA